MTGAGADAVIASYGTIRDLRPAFGDKAPILKLDVTTLSVGGHYPVSEYALCLRRSRTPCGWARQRCSPTCSSGRPFELEALRTAATSGRAGRRARARRTSARSCRWSRGPTPTRPRPWPIAAAARTAAELGAHVVKTTMPDPPEAMSEVAGCGVPVILAGGDFDGDDDALLARMVKRALRGGAAGVAHGRNVWGVGPTRPAPSSGCVRWYTRRPADDRPDGAGHRRQPGHRTGLCARPRACRRERGGHGPRRGAPWSELALELGIEPPWCRSSTLPKGAPRVAAEARRLGGPITILVNNAGRGGWHDRPIWEQERRGVACVDGREPRRPLRAHPPARSRHDRSGLGAHRDGVLHRGPDRALRPCRPTARRSTGCSGRTRSVAQDVAPHGVTCNQVLPGWVRTEMAERDAQTGGQAEGHDSGGRLAGSGPRPAPPAACSSRTRWRRSWPTSAPTPPAR